MDKYIITGGAGFIGSHFCERLVSFNNVTVIDNVSTGNIDNLYQCCNNPNFNLISGSILDCPLTTYMSTDTIFHLAVVVGVKNKQNEVKIISIKKEDFAFFISIT